MKIIHKLDKEVSKDCSDRNLSIFMLSKLGNYFSIPANPSIDVSNYSGYILRDSYAKDDSETMFKTIDNIYLESDSGKLLPHSVINGFTYFERLYDGFCEKFTLVRNGLIYDVESDDNVYINIDLDFRKIHDYDDKGRIYKIHKIDDSLVIEYSKYKDDSLNDKSYSRYMIINGIHIYDAPMTWIKKDYEYDRSRGLRSELYINHALRILSKGKTRLVFSFSDHKSDAISKIHDIRKNYDLISKIHYDYKNNHLELKHNMSQVSGNEIASGYVNAVHAIDGLMIQSNDCIGLWAGLPWFFQYWSRDELVSLKALMLENKKEFSKQVLIRHINSIQPNGRLPNIYTSKGPSGLGSADSIGWLFKRIKDVFSLAEKGESQSYFNLYEIKYIRERLQYSIKQLLNNHYKNGLISNEALETWMDTSNGNDLREGYRIEIQCAFLCMLNLMNMLNHLLANKFVKRDSKLISITSSEFDYKKLERDISRIVRERFFVNGFLNDGWNCSNSFVSRPNVFLAYYFYPELLHNEEWELVFDNAISRLWLEWDIDKKTGGGFSTIDKENPLYQPQYSGQNNLSYHRGDSWFYINNIAAICLYALDKEKYFSYVKKILNASTEDILYRGFIGYASELTSASKFEPGGCFCQTWSIATYIELIHEMFM